MFGSVVSHEKGWKNAIPPSVKIGGGMVYSGAGYLGSALTRSPFEPTRTPPTFRFAM